MNDRRGLAVHPMAMDTKTYGVTMAQMVSVTT
ncbi:hypothetical protein PI124_g14476 [Phytophthora idaei]|nr:hypothetical protein PI125_g18502 [Phytophthora idaei]KAG3137654.1 hypothetical protein PI126_g17290 [Phytophthora idaei]KAG3240616.1 hypothetical protein PI124_g14476 [Phytophthora idaei]